MSIPQAIHPESYSRLLSRSFKLYKAAFFHVFFLSLILALIIFTPRLIAILSGHDFFLDLPPNSPQRLWLVLVDIIGLTFFSAILWRTRCFMTGIHETLFDDFKAALKKIPFIVVAAFIQNIIVGLIFAAFLALGFFLLYLQSIQVSMPGELSSQIPLIIIFVVPFACIIYVFFEFYFFLPIILIENKGIIAALKKSVILVWKNWWKVFKLQLTPWVFYLLSLFILKYIANVNIHIYFTDPIKEYSLLVTLFHILLFAIFVPWFASTMLVQLRDLEIRKHKFA